MQHKVDIIINPVRLRIIQYAAQHKSVTVAQIAQALPDIPRATLYRHVRVLAENRLLQVVKQEKIRGTFEQSYALDLAKINPAGQEGGAEAQALVYTMLAKIMDDFRRYFNTSTANPVADKLFVGTNTLYLGNDAFDGFIQEIYAVVEKYSQTPAGENGCERMITFVSSPALPEEPAEKGE